MKLPTPPIHLEPAKPLPRHMPGWQELTSAAVQAWLALALIGLGSGIIWRVTGIGPSIFTVFDGLGLAYWLVPLLLVGGWEKMRDRQTLHISRGSGIYSLATANAFRVLWYLLLLSLAPLGLFTAFSQASPAVHVFTDMFNLQIGYPGFVLVTLLLSGTTVLYFSLACLVGARRIFGAGFGMVAWGMVGVAINSSVMTGMNFGRYDLSFGGLAEYVRAALNIGLVDPAQIGYINDTVRLIYGVLLVLLLIAVGLLIALQAPNHKPVKKHDSYLLPALLGMLVPGIYTFAHTSKWVADPALAYPLPWQSLFIVGITSLLAVYTVCAWQQEHRHGTRLNPARLLLLGLCPPAWFAFALPIVHGGQVEKLQLAMACTVSMLLILCWVLATNFFVGIRPANPLARSLVLAAMLSALVVPVTGSQYSGLALLLIDTATAFEGQQLLVAVWVSGLVVGMLGIAVWLFGRRAGVAAK